ncbi:hypothetical protein QJS10_CPB18g00138 [Acorus calamus]|uniref:Trichome birefringence-like C-terminal domain-containing protein n=1 Tax=Acorus calamus TaxID=4465 RepID=A0AAV9CN89_ACOCL|nr:hypothetical protein QJS10_CPB18g00138 [Acorus calamus]
MRIVEDVIHEMRVPVILLNITKLTNFRKDGHPSIYRKKLAEGQKVSLRRQDCSHWCLPGVPDAWNELIYASLVMRQKSAWNQRRGHRLGPLLPDIRSPVPAAVARKELRHLLLEAGVPHLELFDLLHQLICLGLHN